MGQGKAVYGWVWVVKLQSTLTITNQRRMYYLHDILRVLNDLKRQDIFFPRTKGQIASETYRAACTSMRIREVVIHG